MVFMADQDSNHIVPELVLVLVLVLLLSIKFSLEQQINELPSRKGILTVHSIKTFGHTITCLKI